MLLEAWRDFEREDGDEKSQAEVGTFSLNFSHPYIISCRSTSYCPEE